MYQQEWDESSPSGLNSVRLAFSRLKFSQVVKRRKCVIWRLRDSSSVEIFQLPQQSGTSAAELFCSCETGKISGSSLRANQGGGSSPPDPAG